jgi:hypothetical protein
LTQAVAEKETAGEMAKTPAAEESGYRLAIQKADPRSM